MASTGAGQQNPSDDRAPLTSDELKKASQIEVYDHAGTKTALGDLIDGKRTVLIFTRHFCMSELLNTRNPQY
jgi:hypothetical protein